MSPNNSPLRYIADIAAVLGIPERTVLDHLEFLHLYNNPSRKLAAKDLEVTVRPRQRVAQWKQELGRNGGAR